MSYANDRSITFRAPSALYARMVQASEVYGGSPAQRIRYACMIHDAQATLVYPDSPRARPS